MKKISFLKTLIDTTKIAVGVLLLILAILIIGYWVASYFETRMLKMKRFMIFTNFILAGLSLLLITTDVPIFLVLATSLALIRWLKYFFQGYPLIEESQALVDFGTSMFISVCSLILWVFYFIMYNSFCVLYFLIFFSLTVFVPVMAFFTICYRNTTEEMNNPTLYNYYKENANKLIQLLSRKQREQNKNKKIE